jgi:hypothetical protein
VGCLFQINKVNKNEAAIKFTVMNGSEEICSAEVDMEMIFDVQNPGKELVLPLKTREPSYAILVIQTMFIPDRKTCFQMGMKRLPDRFQTGESFLHFEFLKKNHNVDQYHFPIPVSEYDPNEIDRINDLNAAMKERLHKSNPMLFSCAEGLSD